MCILSMFVAAAPLQSFAQDSKLPVAVDHSGDDNIGQRLAFSLREVIRGSSGYRLASGREALVFISLVTIDPERSPSASGIWTAAAVAYTMRNDLPLDPNDPQTWYPIFLSASVVIAGMSRVEDQARGILAGLDAQLERYRQDMRAR